LASVREVVKADRWIAGRCLATVRDARLKEAAGAADALGTPRGIPGLGPVKCCVFVS